VHAPPDRAKCKKFAVLAKFARFGRGPHLLRRVRTLAAVFSGVA
jgi:hypothetical protein